MTRQFRAVHIVGDLHGHKHSLWNAYNAGHITKDDIVICLGDVGINYAFEENRVGERNSFAKFPFQFLFLYGNHEQRPEEVDGYEQVRIPSLTKNEHYLNHCGVVYMHKDYPNQWFAIDGAVYLIGNYSFLTVGGATSIDRHRRTAFKTWWPTENVRYKDIEKALNHGTTHFSVILTHTCPEKLIPFQDHYHNPDEKLLQVLYNKLDWDYWFCGHWHIDIDLPTNKFRFLNANISPNDKLTFISFNLRYPMRDASIPFRSSF